MCVYLGIGRYLLEGVLFLVVFYVIVVALFGVHAVHLRNLDVERRMLHLYYWIFDLFLEFMAGFRVLMSFVFTVAFFSQRLWFWQILRGELHYFCLRGAVWDGGDLLFS
jgi:hypothetical protein